MCGGVLGASCRYCGITSALRDITCKQCRGRGDDSAAYGTQCEEIERVIKDTHVRKMRWFRWILQCRQMGTELAAASDGSGELGKLGESCGN